MGTVHDDTLDKGSGHYQDYSSREKRPNFGGHSHDNHSCKVPLDRTKEQSLFNYFSLRNTPAASMSRVGATSRPETCRALSMRKWHENGRNVCQGALLQFSELFIHRVIRPFDCNSRQSIGNSSSCNPCNIKGAGCGSPKRFSVPS